MTNITESMCITQREIILNSTKTQGEKRKGKDNIRGIHITVCENIPPYNNQ